MTLRPYQNKSVEAIRESYRRGNRSPLLVLPTGAGKTIVFTWIAANSKVPVLILVHRVELLRQTSEKLTAFGVDHGLISPKYTPKYGKRVQVASVQTLVNRFDRVSPPGLIIIDEAHHATAGTWRQVLDRYDCLKLGVTATPVRTDGRGLNDVFDDLVIGPSVSELIDLNFLTRPKVYAPAGRIDLSDVRMSGGDYNRSELSEAMDKPTITGDAVKYYRRFADGVPAVAFCVSVEHAKHVAERFRSAGYRSEAVYGGHPKRDEILSSLGYSLDVVTSCDLISEGTDIPAIGCAILLRPTVSEGLYLQQVGRALRVYDGREYAVVLDHVGNVMKHGMPDEVRPWTLEGRKKGERRKTDEVKASECPSCYAVYPSGRVCPECGHERELTPREIQEQEGELVEVQRIERRKTQGRARTYDELVAIGRSRGYKNPQYWAKRVMGGRKR